ncbi:MAG TPA: hypothetical protein VFR93_09850 [Candidatus Limnocylindrales bacterium]|jgi:hypothetical protein|nr:hypothetical protein [Candidatus Limnocylindrales bacterium]
MERSIAARYAARPAARFVTTSSRARERRLGLRGAGTFRPASTRMTILRRPSDSILARLRGDWRAIRPAAPRRTDGRPRPAVAMTWTGTAVAPSARRSSAATAPWRG